MNKVSWWFTEINTKAEKKKVLSSFDNMHFSLGPVTKELEDKLASTLEVPYVVMTNSGTSALTISLMAIDIMPGDEVIVPDLTWIATAQAVEIHGAKLVFVDCQSDVPLIDVSEVKKKITNKTKAIIPVHLNGRACQLDELLNIAKRNHIALIEDACKAFYSKTSAGFLGTLGDLGCFSMGMVSLVSACYGGFVATRNEQLYNKLKLIRDHGVRRETKEIYFMRGSNFKVSDILSSIGVAQLSRLSEKKNHVDKIYNRYLEGLSSLDYIRIFPVDIESGETALLAEVRSDYREQIIDYLADNGVATERFHIPLHCAKYMGFKYSEKNTIDDYQDEFPNATRFSKEGFILPSGPSQPLSNVDLCIDLLKKWAPY